MPFGFIALATATLALFCAIFLLADYSWEGRKSRRMRSKAPVTWVRSGWEPVEYKWYSWIRYLTIIFITFINVVPIFRDVPGQNAVLLAPRRMVCLILIVVLLAFAFFTIDGYWDRRRVRGLSTAQTVAFWLYFWIRYPALIAATVQAAREGLVR